MRNMLSVAKFVFDVFRVPYHMCVLRLIDHDHWCFASLTAVLCGPCSKSRRAMIHLICVVH